MLLPMGDRRGLSLFVGPLGHQKTWKIFFVRIDSIYQPRKALPLEVNGTHRFIYKQKVRHKDFALLIALSYFYSFLL